MILKADETGIYCDDYFLPEHTQTEACSSSWLLTQKNTRLTVCEIPSSISHLKTAADLSNKISLCFEMTFLTI